MSDRDVGHILTTMGMSSMRSGTSGSGTYHASFSIPAASTAAISPSTPAPSFSGISPQNQLSTPDVNPTHPSPDSQSQSPKPGSRSTTRKWTRSRPTKSCEECRRKKLKCDRELPCSNCLKGGRDGTGCVFKDGPGGDKETSWQVGADDRKRGVKRFRLEGPGSQTQFIVPQHQSYPQGSNSGGEMRGNWAAQPQSNHESPVGGEVRGNWAPLPQVAGLASNTVPPSPDIHNVPTPASNSSRVQHAPTRTLGYVHIKGNISRYIGPGDRMPMMDAVSILPC